MRFFVISTLFMGLTAAAPAPNLPAAYDRRQPALKGEPPIDIARRDDLLNFAKLTVTAPVVTVTAPVVTGTAKSVPKPNAAKAEGTGTIIHAHVPRATRTGTAASVYEAAPTHHDDKAVEYNFPSPTNIVVDTPVAAVGHWWLQ